MIGPKVPIFRSEKYRRYVAAQECFACGIEGYSQCCHPNFGKGMSLKTDDRLSFPLCSQRPGTMGCHQQLDLLIEMTRDERREDERRYGAEMQARAKAAGWFKEEIAA